MCLHLRNLFVNLHVLNEIHLLLVYALSLSGENISFFYYYYYYYLLTYLLTALKLSLGGSSPYTSTDKRNKNK